MKRPKGSLNASQINSHVDKESEKNFLDLLAQKNAARNV